MTRLYKISPGALLTIATLNLSGCISLLPSAGPAPDLITLNPQLENAHISSSKSLLIDEPTGPIIYDGTKIVIQKESPSGLTSFTYAKEEQWAERLPKMIQRAMIDHLKSPQWPTVMDGTMSLAADYRMFVEIRKFQIRMPDLVEVSMSLTIINSQDQKILTTKTLNYSIKCENTVTSYIQAFNKATAQLLQDSDALIAQTIHR
jgi:ABC-type uncharacterized transport system auxiliary subunit